MKACVRRPAFLPPAMRPQQGASLIVSLLMLTATVMLGMSAARIAVQEEKAARNARDRQVALQAAEAALTDAEMDIERSVRRHLFASDRGEGFVEGCGSGQADLYRGLCRSDPLGQPVWRTVDFMDVGQARFVPYGRFTGRRLPTGEGMLPARPPGYIIELMSYGDSRHAESGSSPTYFYRITAVGFGMRESTQVMLQTFYRKSDGGSRETIVPAGRFGWREIENWQELRNVRG